MKLLHALLLPACVHPLHMGAGPCVDLCCLFPQGPLGDALEISKLDSLLTSSSELEAKFKEADTDGDGM